jgi:hypothetical protein
MVLKRSLSTGEKAVLWFKMPVSSAAVFGQYAGIKSDRA